MKFVYSETRQMIKNGRSVLNLYKSNVDISGRIIKECQQVEFLKEKAAENQEFGNEKLFYVKAGCTDKNKIKMGLGTKIRQECMDYCVRNNIKHMMVEASGIGTYKIYKKLGWEEVKSVKYETLFGKYVVDNEANRRFVSVNPSITLFYKYFGEDTSK